MQQRLPNGNRYQPDLSILTYQTAGLQPSDLILIAARPSMGKTAFVLNIAQYVAFHEDMCTAIFFGDVERTAGKPSVLSGIKSGRTGSAYR